ncbi:MAG: agmatine deiminase family protein [Paludibacter sp.]|nr:agmatine deiminase family protein [Paludibacter sp.]
MEMQKILPPEWAKQRFIQLTWPHTDTDWADMLDEVENCFADIARAIIKFQSLLIICQDEQAVKERIGKVDFSRISFAEIASNDTWARDHGGITVLEDEKRVVYDFGFNGWGKKFNAELDNQITRRLWEGNYLGKDVAYRNCLDFVLEGGSFESDGEGTLLTTAECLLSENRNDLSKEEIEVHLKEYFGLDRILWLHHGYLAGDDTDSHIDTLVRLCSVDTIAYVKCDDMDDEHFAALQQMEAELQQLKQKNGERYKLIPLPMADAVYDGNDRLPATYANFLIINGAVLAPIYNSPKDIIAINQLQQAFPDRKIIGINCLPLIKQHGSLHCVTMQYV